MKINEITKCRICGNKDLIQILDLGIQALQGRFPRIDETDPPKAPLQLVKCNDSKNKDNCGLLQLKHSVDPDELYKHNYGYRSGINQTMTNHLRDIVDKIKSIVDLKNGDVVVDIGANDGTLLRYYDHSLKRIGIDPSINNFKEFYQNDNIFTVNDYFSVKAYNLATRDKAKVITSIAMFYDLEDPISFVGDIKNVLHPNGIWVLEQGYMPMMLQQNLFDSVCSEHLEYHALKQIDWIMKAKNLRIIDVELNDINGGSFQVWVCHKDAHYRSNLRNIDKVFFNEKKLRLDTKQPYEVFKKRIYRIKDELYKFIVDEKTKGKTIMVLGASTKGNTLLQFCNLDNKLISAASDRNPNKWGCRMANNIPIISEEDARKADPDYFLVLPYHFKKELIEREKEYLMSGGELIFPLPKVEIIGGKYSENKQKEVS